jgi:hypothetical protein
MNAELALSWRWHAAAWMDGLRCMQCMTAMRVLQADCVGAKADATKNVMDLHAKIPLKYSIVDGVSVAQPTPTQEAPEEEGRNSGIPLSNAGPAPAVTPDTFGTAPEVLQPSPPGPPEVGADGSGPATPPPTTGAASGDAGSETTAVRAESLRSSAPGLQPRTWLPVLAAAAAAAVAAAVR